MEDLLCPYDFLHAGDNPMQAEECSHSGLNSNLFCRTCKVGGTKIFKSSDEGFATLFEVGIFSVQPSSADYVKSGELRTPADTREAILEQLRLSTLSGGTDKVKKAATATGVNDASSAPVIELLLEMGKALRRRGVGKTALPEAEIQKILEDEMAKQLKRYPINPLIGMRGTLPSCLHRCRFQHVCPQVLIYIRIRPLKSSTPSCLAS
jgi:hypothetical protein